jgi:hypothetical protein
MLVFNPDSPWAVGDKVTVTKDGKVVAVVRITEVEQSPDGTETQYQTEPWSTDLLRHMLYSYVEVDG